MKTRLIITDLTRMNQGRVCIAGYAENHQCIRPVLPPPGIAEKSLVNDHKPMVYPFALIELTLQHPKPQPPHTEDHYFDPDSIRHIQAVQDRRTVLKWSLFQSVEEVFGQPVHHGPGFYVMDCQGARSLGTVKPTRILEAKYAQDNDGAWDYRLAFYDAKDNYYRLKITDLTWQYYCRSLRGEERDPEKIAAELTGRLKKSEVYLRIGLARGWSEYPDRCFLQITGVFTFPDYLGGKNFYDFIYELSQDYDAYPSCSLATAAPPC
jgi:hypothetical protein